MLTDSTRVQTEPIRISIAFEGIPELGDEQLDILMDFVALNKNAKLQIVLPPAAKPDAQRFKKDALAEILKRRSDSGVSAKGVNLEIITDVKDRLSFIKSTVARTLIIDPNYQSLAKIKSQKISTERLLVHDDSPLHVKAVALLAALEELLQQKNIPETIQTALGLLQSVSNLQIRALADQLLSQSA